MIQIPMSQNVGIHWLGKHAEPEAILLWAREQPARPRKNDQKQCGKHRKRCVNIKGVAKDLGRPFALLFQQFIDNLHNLETREIKLEWSGCEKEDTVWSQVKGRGRAASYKLTKYISTLVIYKLQICPAF